MKKYFGFLVALFVLLGAGYLFLVHTVMPKYLRQMLPVAEEMASEYINGSVKLGDLTWNGGLSAEVKDVLVQDAQGRKVVELPRVILHLRPWQAIQKTERALSKVEILRPQVYLTMNDKKQWNMSSLLKPSDSEETPFYGILAVEGGALHLAMPEGEWTFPVSGTVNGGANPKFALDLAVQSGADTLRVGGLVTTKGEGRIEVKSDGVELAPYGVLAKSYANINEFSGSLGKLALLYVNESSTKRFSGEVALRGLAGKTELNGEQHSLRVDGLVRAHDNVVSVSDLQAFVDEQALHLEAEADLRDLDKVSGEGVLTAPKLTYGKYTLEELRLPFRVGEKQLIAEKLSARYGGGTIGGSATYSMDEKNLTADLDVRNVTYAADESGQNDVSVNAKLAVLAQQKEDSVLVQAAADTMDLRWRNLNVKKMSLDGVWNSEGLVIDHFSASAGERGILMAAGKVSPEGALQLKGRMTEFPINPFLTAAGQDGRGLCSTGFALGGRLDAPEFAGVIQLHETEFMQQKIVEAHGFVSLKDNLLTVKNFSANMDQGKHTVSGTVNLQGSEPVLDISLETENVRIEPIMRLLTGSQEAVVTGNLNNIMQVRGAVSNPSVYGEVHAFDGSAAEQLYNNVDGRYSYDQGRLQLKDFLIKAFYADIKLDGTMEADGRLDFDMDAQNVELSQLPIKDDTMALAGKINLKGEVNGTLTAPTFMGNVNAKKITVNGEALTEIEGTVNGHGAEKNTLALTFKQPYKHDASAYGIYSADLDLNVREHFMQGKVQMLWGDIGGLLRMARMDYDINGQMQGVLDFCPNGKGSGVKLAVTADDVKIHDLNYAHMTVKGTLQRALLNFDEVKLQEQDGVTDKGLITVGGSVNLKDKILNIDMASVKANPAIVTAVMKNPPEIKGEMDLTAQLRGTFDNPAGSAVLEISNGSVSGVSMDKLNAALTLEDDNIKLQELSATKDVYGVKGSGDIPLDIFRSKEQRRNPRAEMNILMDLNDARLGILPAMTKRVEWGVGETNGAVRLAGTLEEPLLFGSLKIEDGAVKIKGVDTVLEKINLDVDFQGNIVALRNFSTNLGKGTLTAEGSYALQTTEDAAYKLHIKADNAELASQIFTGRINSDLELVPQDYFDPNKAKDAKRNGPPKREYRPLLQGSVKLEDVLVNMPTIPELGEGESNLGLKLQLDLGKRIHLYNSYLYDIWLSGGMKIDGSTVFPVVDGMIKAEKGTITYLRTDFKLKEARLNWIEPGTFLPNVTLNSTARFSRYNIFMGITGSVENMELQLTSDPPMERNTIVRMLTLQRDTAGSNEVTGEDVNNLLSVGLQMTVLGDVETWIKQNLGIDQFRIYTGRVRSGIGFESTKSKSQELTSDERNQYNVLVSKYLNNNFMFGYTTSFNALDKSIFGQYDIGKHINLTYSRSYDMNSKSENWMGLEYKISF